MNKKDKFQQLQKKVETKKNQLTLAKGELKSLKKQAREEFDTDDTEELTQLKKQYETDLQKKERKFDKISERIEELISQIEEAEEEDED